METGKYKMQRTIHGNITRVFYYRQNILRGNALSMNYWWNKLFIIKLVTINNHMYISM